MGDFDKTKYTIEYIRKNTRQFMFKVSRIYDPEMVEWLESQDNINEYLKKLVRDDMQKAEGNG